MSYHSSQVGISGAQHLHLEAFTPYANGGDSQLLHIGNGNDTPKSGQLQETFPSFPIGSKESGWCWYICTISSGPHEVGRRLDVYYFRGASAANREEFPFKIQSVIGFVHYFY